MADALVLDQVTKQFRNVLAVDQLSLKVPQGSIYGFLGPNGAGKTTTIRMVMDIFYPDSGQITVLGNNQPGLVKDRLGYLPEEKGLYQKMKVGELVSYFGQLKGLSASESRKRAADLLHKFGLGHCLKQRCNALSKGMGQKVQIIATLIHEPELVILDEPFSGLDPVNMELVREIVLDMKRSGKTVIFSTHVMAQAEQMCDYIMLLYGGKKVLDGSIAQVKSGYGSSLVVDYDGDSGAFANLPGVCSYRDVGHHVEMQLEDGADDQAVLAALVGKVTIRRFEKRELSLHEIFILEVGSRLNG